MPNGLISISEPLVRVPLDRLAGMSSAARRSLAVALASHAGKTDPDKVTVEDLLNYFPTRYEDRSNLLPIDELTPDMEAAVEITVKVSGGFRVGKQRHPRQPPLFLFEISGNDRNNQHRPVVVKWFVSGKAAERIVGFYQQRFGRGVVFVAYGKWEWDASRQTFALMVAKPEELEILPSGAAIAPLPSVAADDDEDAVRPEFVPVHTGRRVPVYRKLGQFQTKRLREVVFSVLQALDPASIVDPLPKELLARQGLLTRFESIKGIHLPPLESSLADYAAFRSPAQTRLIFDEFFWLSFQMQLLRGERRKEPKGMVVEITDQMRRRIEELPPFSLTNAQTRTLTEILDDLTSDEPMNRLIQGDVGSGKTIVAFLAALVAIENGYQAAIMAPTEILAEQHMRNAMKFFADTGHRPGLLVGSLKAAEKRRVYQEIESGDIQLLIGTHAIIQEAVRFAKLGLVVIDEQHRFGVLQRAHLRALGMNPDTLVMTATPIPRSLAMTVYGDLDVSIIDEMPPGRTPVKTVVVGEDQRPGVYKGVIRELDLGRQVYVVYPLVEESAKTDLKAATQMFEDLRDRIFPDRRIGLLHGRMKAAEKEAVMKDFVEQRLDILVSTTVIEVGVDVPNASLMVIEHAERFGLSQLHQLRGRVGRGSEQSFCVLLTTHKKTAIAKERLGIMERSSDGFVIAEKDLELRGQGEILGTRQSGMENFRLANIARDLEILTAARKEAEHYLNDKRLSSETSELVRTARSDPRTLLGKIG